MECSVTGVALSGDLPTPAPVNRDGGICCYLFDFPLTFTARRFNLREPFFSCIFKRVWRADQFISATHLAL